MSKFLKRCQHNILEIIPVETKRLLSHDDNQFLSPSFQSLYLLIGAIMFEPRQNQDKIISTKSFIRISFFLLSASGVPHRLKGLGQCCSGSTTSWWAAYLVIVVTTIDKHISSCIPCHCQNNFWILFKTSLTSPPHPFVHLVDFFDGLGGTLHCSKIGQNKA